MIDLKASYHNIQFKHELSYDPTFAMHCGKYHSLQMPMGLTQAPTHFQFVMESCVQVVDKAMRMVGGAALFKKNPMEQMYRDVRAAVIHQPFAGMEGKALLGRRTFGLPVYTSPRFV